MRQLMTVASVYSSVALKQSVLMQRKLFPSSASLLEVIECQFIVTFAQLGV
jgi:hypothetical protein